MARRYAMSAAGILAILLAWEIYTRAFKVPHYLVPAPSVIGWTLVEEWPTIQRNVGRTLVEAVGGFVLGNGFAVALAIVFVTHNVFEAVFLSSRILVMSRQPGRILAEVPVDLPYPRAPEIRTSPEYGRLVGQVIKLLN